MIGVLIFGCRQGAGVELAVDGHRQRVDNHDGSRDHIGGQPPGELGTDLGRVRGPGDVADQAQGGGSILTGDHHRLLHPGDPGQRRLDLTEFDAVPADLDLLVDTPQMLKLPIGGPAHQIPGAVHPLPRAAERTRHESRRRQPRPTQIPGAHTGTGHIQLTDHPGGHRTQPRVQDEQRRPGHRRPDRHYIFLAR